MIDRVKAHKTLIGILLLGITALFLPIILLVSRDVVKINSRASIDNNPAFLSRPSSAPIVKDGGNNVVIENVTIQGGSVNNPTGQGIAIRNVNGSITIRNVDLANLQSGIYIYNSTGTILIENLRSRNIGTKTSSNGDIGAGKSNHIQFAESSLEGFVRNNKFLGGRTEDMVSTWHSGGLGVGQELIFENNQFQGLVNDTSTARAWDSTSGTGIIIGDGGGSSKNGYIIVRNNTFLTPGQVGIQHIDGPGLQTYGNIIYGEKRPQNNNPMTSWEGNPRGTVRDNRYFWTNENGSEPSPWFDEYGSMTLSNNIKDSSINLADLAIDMNSGSSAPTPTLTTATNTPTPTTTSNPVGPTGYVYCATENHNNPEQCTFSGIRNVAYGRDGAFVYKVATSPVVCSNETFGSDPVVGQTKYCFYGLASLSTTPTITNTPTPSPEPNATILRFPTIKLHGIGSGGDNTNPNLGGNPNPLRTTRDVAVELIDAGGTTLPVVNSQINFNSGSGVFSADIELPTSVASGNYLVKIKSPQYLKKQATGIINITKSQTNNIPEISLTTGDMDNDNALTIQDYNILIDCYSDLLPPKNCSDTSKKQSADISDDGNVNANDYNLFLRELSVASGD